MRDLGGYRRRLSGRRLQRQSRLHHIQLAMFPSPMAHFVDMSQGGIMIIFAVKVFGVVRVSSKRFGTKTYIVAGAQASPLLLCCA